MDIATHLSPTAQNTLAQGKLGPTVAHALCGVPCTDQDALLSCIDCHGLKLREALALVSAYRVADKQDRRILLNAPLDLLRPEPHPSPASSPALTECEQPLESIRQALVSLADFAIPPEIAPAEKRRFETPAGEEMQIDWSPYYVRIAAVTRILYAFGCLLCSSRKLWVHFYRDERQSTLLEAIACAFEYFFGCALPLVLDNMATAVLGRYGPHGQPVWHPRFLDFPRHYGFQPVACAVRDLDRKGKKEKSFRLLWDNFLKDCQFDSLEDLNQRLMIWLDQTPEVANQRQPVVPIDSNSRRAV